MKHSITATILLFAVAPAVASVPAHVTHAATPITVNITFTLPSDAQSTLTKSVSSQNPHELNQLFELLSNLCPQPAVTNGATHSNTVHRLVHGLHTLQARMDELCVHANQDVAQHLKNLSATIDDIIEQSEDSAMHKTPGTITRSVDVDRVNREKLNQLALNVEKLTTMISTLATKLGTTNTQCRNLSNLEELEEIDNADLSVIEFLKAIYHKLQTITG